MWRGAVRIAVALGAAVAVMPALAADHATIAASDVQFDPDAVTIVVGDTVTFANSGGFHNFAFADGQKYPSSPRSHEDAVWNGLSRTFNEPGEYRYVCEAHEVQGMAGVITVTPAGATPTPTRTPGPTPTPPPGGGPSGGGSGGGAGDAAVEVQTLRLAGTTFCTKRSSTCRRPGVRVRIDLSRAARVTGTLRRRPPRGSGRLRSFGRVSLGTVSPGPRTLRFSRTTTGKRLTAGRYTLTVAAGDAAPRTLRFRVR